MCLFSKAACWPIWWIPDCYHAKGNLERSWLPTLREENSQGYKRCI